MYEHNLGWRIFNSMLILNFGVFMKFRVPIYNYKKHHFEQYIDRKMEHVQIHLTYLDILKHFYEKNKLKVVESFHS
jgi:hypothetical protein